MQAQRNTSSKGIKFWETKVLIAALSLGVSVGLWNTFAQQANPAKQTPAQVVTLPAQQQTDGQGVPPLPTLVPEVTLQQSNLAQFPATKAGSGQTAAQAGQNAPTQLRSVDAPDGSNIVQKRAPIISQNVTVVTVGGGNGGSSRGSAPVTSTHTS